MNNLFRQIKKFNRSKAIKTMKVKILYLKTKISLHLTKLVQIIPMKKAKMKVLSK